ncbi:MAG: hypothetical protein K2Q34_04520 [Alphaproteobacteria bacterium]|nr:hypothetical protein [Alphaproteobacteria bacterium]
MKKTILLSAIILPLFIGSASANIVVDEMADVFHKTAVTVGGAIHTVIEAVSEVFSPHGQKVSPVHGRTLSPSEMFHNAKVDDMPQAEENSSLVLASMYPELARVDPPSSVQKLSNKGSSVLKELKRQEEKEDLTASEYMFLVSEVSQNASSAVPFLVGQGATESAIINWDGVTYDKNPNADADALLAKMASTHTRNPNSALLSKAGR